MHFAVLSSFNVKKFFFKIYKFHKVAVLCAYFVADCAVFNEFLLKLVSTIKRLFAFLLHAMQLLLDGSHCVERR